MNGMNMKKIIVSLCLLMVSAVTAWGQQDSKAVQVLDRLAEQFRKAGGVQITFGGTQKGVLELQGNSFHLKNEDMESWFDGKTQWSYLLQNEEVNVSTPTPEEVQGINPYALLENYKKVFRCLYKGDARRAGRLGDEVVLIPMNGGEISMITFTVDKGKATPLYIGIELTSGDMQEIEVKDFRTGLKWETEHFRFDPKQFPDAEVIDLR